MKIVVTKRGGKRKRQPLVRSTSRALQFLFNEVGGIFRVAEVLGIHYQQLSRWIRDGYVPLKWVGKLSRAMDCNWYLLNYEGMISLFGNGAEWAETLKLFTKKFPKDELEFILEGKMPKKVKEILNG